MSLLIANWYWLAIALCCATAYFCWKMNGGSIIEFKDTSGRGSAPLIEQILIGLFYVGFSVGMICVDAVVAMVLRLLLLFTAFGAFDVGNNEVGCLCMFFALGTAVISLLVYMRSPYRR